MGNHTIASRHSLLRSTRHPDTVFGTASTDRRRAQNMSAMSAPMLMNSLVYHELLLRHAWKFWGVMG